MLNLWRAGEDEDASDTVMFRIDRFFLDRLSEQPDSASENRRRRQE
jgi:hypothetical protein